MPRLSKLPEDNRLRRTADALLAVWGDKWREVLTAYHKDFSVLIFQDMEAFALVREDAPLGEEGQRVEGRRQLFNHLCNIRELKIDDVATYAEFLNGRRHDDT